MLFLKKVFFGLFSLVLLDWVTGSGPIEEMTGTIFTKCLFGSKTTPSPPLVSTVMLRGAAGRDWSGQLLSKFLEL